ncbi:MAG: hypothetical protein OEZ02_05465 [Anaerolineae bacterium]|nr:hypothetical protein [Anaerolineae bacterium]
MLTRSSILKCSLTIPSILLLLGCASPSLVGSPPVQIPTKTVVVPTISQNAPTALTTPLNKESLESCQTLTPAATDTKDNIIPGHIFYWSINGLYTRRLADDKGALGVSTKLDSFFPAEHTLELYSRLSLTFSRYSQKLAYAHINEKNSLELWVADLNLCSLKKVFEDTDQWLGEEPGKKMWPLAIQIIWGPDDNSIIVVNQTKIIVISLTTNEKFQWSGTCDKILRSPVSDQFALGCSLEQEEGQQFGLIEMDGTIQMHPRPLADLGVTTLEWAISPQGDRVLYTTEDYHLFVGELAGNDLALPLTWNLRMVRGFRLDTYKKGLRWSNDGSKLLVFGYESSGNLCPKDPEGLHDMDIENPCWVVLDASTGEIVWWLKTDLLDGFGKPASGWNTFYEAVFSPDDKWLLMSFMITPIRYTLLISLEEDQIIILGNYALSNISWGD